MNAGGWVFMVTSLTLVGALAGWCFFKVLTTPPED